MLKIVFTIKLVRVCLCKLVPSVGIALEAGSLTSGFLRVTCLLLVTCPATIVPSFKGPRGGTGRFICTPKCRIQVCYKAQWARFTSTLQLPYAVPAMQRSCSYSSARLFRRVYGCFALPDRNRAAGAYQ